MIDTAADVARGIRVLRGRCPNCGTVVEARGSGVAVVSCTSCSTTVQVVAVD